MPINIGSNIASLQVQRQLGQASSALDSSFEKLSSGLRINRAKDDAAGLSVATALSSTAKILKQGVRNVNDGVSLLSIAEDSVKQLSSIVIRQRELATQALNGTFSRTQRRSLDAESKALTAEYNRIVQSTSFNGIKPLASSDSGITLQIGSDSSGTLLIDAGTNTSGIGRTVGSGAYSQTGAITGIAGGGLSQTIDFNKDGKLDLIFGGAISIGNGDGTFLASYTLAVNASDAYLYDINGDNIEDLVVLKTSSANVEVRLGNGDGTYGGIVTTSSSLSSVDDLRFGDINGDGLTDVIGMQGSNGIVMISDGDGTFSLGSTFTSSNSTGYITLADVNNDGRADLIDHANNSVINIYNSNGSGFSSSFTSTSGTGVLFNFIQAEDFNGDGYSDFILGNGTLFINNGDGTFKAGTSLATGTAARLADFNGDGKKDIIITYTGTGSIYAIASNGDGTFAAAVSSVISPGIHSSGIGAIGDFNGDGALDVSLKLSVGGDQMIFGSRTTTTSAAEVNLRTRAGAYAAVQSLSTVQESIERALGTIGAHLSRLSIAANNNDNAVENFLTAAAQINDTDVAQESASLVSRRILQQAATAVLAQANQAPLLALKLLNDD